MMRTCGCVVWIWTLEGRSRDSGLGQKGRRGTKANDLPQELSAKINRSIEQQVAAAASSGKLTIMKNVAMEGYVYHVCRCPPQPPIVTRFEAHGSCLNFGSRVASTARQSYILPASHSHLHFAFSHSTSAEKGKEKEKAKAPKPKKA